jgi:outer membrane protein W
MKPYSLILFFMFVGAGAFAQEKYFYVNWDVNKPLTNTNWVSDVSTRGIKAGYRVFINERFSAGLDIGATTFDQYQPKTTIESPGGAITTDYFKYIYSYSAVASGQYYFKAKDETRLLPYAGLGLGANYNEYTLYYNIYTDKNSGWGFLARPEAGLLFRISERRSLGLMAAIHYDYSTNKAPMFNYSGFSAIGFQIGIISMDW